MALDFDSKSWSVMSWLSPFAALGLMGFLFTSSIGQGQISSAFHRSRTVNPANLAFKCTLISFFSFDANEEVSDLIHIEGRGLATCRNAQGVSTEIPVDGDLEAIVTAPLANSGDLSFSANSAAFVVPREIGQLQDRFTVKTVVRDLSGQPTVLLQGAQQGLVIEMKFVSSTQTFRKIEVRALTLHFDETAPTID